MSLIRTHAPGGLPPAAGFFLLLTLVSCTDIGVDPSGDGGSRQEQPSENASFCLDSGFEIVQGARKDAIPALANPRFVAPGTPGTEPLTDDEPVVGFVIKEEALALPLYVMRWHEIVNLDRPGLRVAVTYCPLTGTAIAFDRLAAGGVELGVSGLLAENNLIMYDRSSDDSLFPQMLGSAICGRLRGRKLSRLPLMVTSFGGWRSLHPETKVLSTETGYARDYWANPYLDYDRLDAPPLFDTERSRDTRRLPKEPVLGIASERGPGLAIPLGPLADHERAAFRVRVDDRPVTVLWDRRLQVAAAFEQAPEWANGYVPPSPDAPTFSATGGGFVDSVTGSVWTVEGVAVSGPAEGSSLVAVEESMMAYWFAWAAFNPGTAIVTEF